MAPPEGKAYCQEHAAVHAGIMRASRNKPFESEPVCVCGSPRPGEGTCPYYKSGIHQYVDNG